MRRQGRKEEWCWPVRCHSLPSTIVVKRRQKRVYGEKFLFLVHSIHIGSGWSARQEAWYCLKPIVQTVSSSASPNSIPAVQASADSSSCRAHPKKIINSISDVACLSSDVHILSPTESCRCQEQVGLANHTRPFLSAGAYTASDNALR